MAGMVEIHLDRSGVGMGAWVLCGDGAAGTIIDAVCWLFDDH